MQEKLPRAARDEGAPRGAGRGTPRAARGDAHPLGKGYDKGRSNPARRGKKHPPRCGWTREKGYDKGRSDPARRCAPARQGV